MTDLNKWLADTRREKTYSGLANRILEVRKRIICADGISLSVQAGELLYCEPRSNYGPYASVEVGFPDACPEGWEEWAETAGTTQTVWGFIPIEKVEAFIDAHGGMREGRC